MAKEFLNRSGVMLLQAVIGLSYIDEQEIIDAWKKTKFTIMFGKIRTAACIPLSTHFPESSLKSAVLSISSSASWPFSEERDRKPF